MNLGGVPQIYSGWDRNWYPHVEPIGFNRIQSKKPGPIIDDQELRAVEDMAMSSDEEEFQILDIPPRKRQTFNADPDWKYSQNLRYI